jgi:hypothetical protein
VRPSFHEQMAARKEVRPHGLVLEGRVPVAHSWHGRPVRGPDAGGTKVKRMLERWRTRDPPAWPRSAWAWT